jgi:hypothetical protein
MSVKITELKNGDFKIAIFTTNETDNPDKLLDNAVAQYVDGKPHIELINSNCDDPWTRVIMSQISDDITKDWITFQSYIRDNKIDELLKK